MPDLMDIDQEFDDIIRALREERPEIDPGFARELDQRAAGGFEKPRRRLRMPRISVLGPPVAGLATLALVVAVISGVDGSNSGGADSSGGGSGGSTAVSQAPPEPESDAAGDRSFEIAPQRPQRDAAKTDELKGSAVASAGAAAPVQGGARGRVQEKSAGITLEADGKEIGDVGDRVIGVADQVGGFVTSSSVRATDGDSGGGDFQLRVPVARLDDALARLSRLAHVTERTQGSQDITAERNVARDRYQEALAERKSLLKRLAEADTTPEVESLKAQLRDVSRAIAAYKTSLNQVARRAQFASVAVTLTAKAKKDVVGPAEDGKWTPADAIRDAGRVLEVAAGVVVIVGSVLLPLALLGLLALFGQRLAGRRGRQRVLETV